jgi:hypothetical protein
VLSELTALHRGVKRREFAFDQQKRPLQGVVGPCVRPAAPAHRSRSCPSRALPARHTPHAPGHGGRGEVLAHLARAHLPGNAEAIAQPAALPGTAAVCRQPCPETIRLRLSVTLECQRHHIAERRCARCTHQHQVMARNAAFNRKKATVGRAILPIDNHFLGEDRLIQRRYPLKVGIEPEERPQGGDITRASCTLRLNRIGTELIVDFLQLGVGVAGIVAAGNLDRAVAQNLRDFGQ